MNRNDKITIRTRTFLFHGNGDQIVLKWTQLERALGVRNSFRTRDDVIVPRGLHFAFIHSFNGQLHLIRNFVGRQKQACGGIRHWTPSNSSSTTATRPAVVVAFDHYNPANPPTARHVAKRKITSPARWKVKARQERRRRKTKMCGERRGRKKRTNSWAPIWSDGGSGPADDQFLVFLICPSLCLPKKKKKIQPRTINNFSQGALWLAENIDSSTFTLFPVALMRTYVAVSPSPPESATRPDRARARERAHTHTHSHADHVRGPPLLDDRVLSNESYWRASRSGDAMVGGGAKDERRGVEGGGGKRRDVRRMRNHRA